MSSAPMFRVEDDVLILVRDPDLEAPQPVEGRVRGEDPAGVLVETLTPVSDEGSPVGRVFYVPYARIECLLLLEKRTEAELEELRWEGHVRKQRVLDELDRIFFELAEKKGTYVGLEADGAGAPGSQPPRTTPVPPPGPGEGTAGARRESGGTPPPA